LVGALLLEQNDEWAVQRARYMTLETMAQMSDDPQISLPRCDVGLGNERDSRLIHCPNCPVWTASVKP
ncbi:hypothetical protein CO665_34475, partial [Rhizobium anhuiense]